MTFKSSLKWFRDRVGPPLYRIIRSLWTPPACAYRHLPFFGTFSVEVAPGIRIRLRGKGQIVENELFWAGFAKTWEHESLRIWCEKVRSARTVVDIGANSGIYAIVAKAIKPTAQVIALEPSAAVAKSLRENVRLNGLDIQIEEIAASDSNGRATFHDFEGEHQYSASLEKGMGGTIERQVRVVRVDDLLEGPIDLVKIDVEMHEPAVLRGMRQILERDRPILLIEILNDEVRRGVEDALSGLFYSWNRIGDGETWTNYVLQPVQPAPND